MARDKARYNERMRDYMVRYRASKSEKAAQKDTWMREVGDFLKEELVRDLMVQGRSREAAELYFDEYCTPPELREEEEPERLEAEEESQSVATATDSVSPCQRVEGPKEAVVKKDCWGTEKSIKCQGSCNPACYHAYLDESMKPQWKKDSERRDKIHALLEKNKEMLRKSELEDLVRIGSFMQEAKERRRKEIDDIAQKYLARGIPEVAARESAEWELKQEQRRRQREWDSMTKDEQSAYVEKLLRDSKKLQGEK